VIAHRLSTAERSDRVGVVDAGGLVELGTHDELLALGGRYFALYQAWVGQHGENDDEVIEETLGGSGLAVSESA
jgi:ABC-type multidrug transport system ATPase subunit